MKRFSLIISVLLLTLIGVGCDDSTASERYLKNADHFQRQGFRFIVAADPQLFRGQKENLDRAIEAINDFDPAFVVMCGDLIETPSNLEQIQAYKDSVAGLNSTIPLYNLPGNHDLGRPVSVKHIKTYQENFGPLWYHFTYGNSLFVILASDILRDPDAPMNKEHTEWLLNILEESRSKTIDHLFIFMHHPLYIHAPDEPDGYSNMPVEIRRTLLDLFVQHRIRAVFSGHLHRNRINNYQGMELIILNSITVPMGENVDAAGFRIIDVYSDKYKHRYYEVPAGSSDPAMALRP